MQNALGKSYDVVSTMAKYFLCMEAYPTPNSLREMTQCLNSLTESIQGPCPGNQAVMLDMKVIDTAMKVLAWTEHDIEVRRCVTSAPSCSSTLTLRRVNRAPGPWSGVR